MSLPYGLQSVLFYVLSCSTCAKIKHRHKAKKKAKAEREEKHALESEQPGLYRHPSPFSTNPYWEEEIILGPSGPKRKGDKGGSKNASTRALNTAVPVSSATSDGGMSTDAGSSPTMVQEEIISEGVDWNRKRYQREDEELWGHEIQRAGQRVREALATAGSQMGSTLRAWEGRLSKSGPLKEEESPYLVVKNPPVNELHPPVVSSQPTRKDAMRWMLQPPPSAKVMEGKESPNRSRSVSRASSRRELREVDSLNLSRQVTGRAVEERLRRGETPEMLPLSRPHSQAKSPEMRPLTRPDSRTKSPELRPLTRPTSRTRTHGAGTPRSHRLHKTGSHSLESSDEDAPQRFKPSPLFSAVAGRRLSEDSIEEVPLPFELSSFKTTKPEREGPPRPALSTIASSTNSPPVLSPDSEKRQFLDVALSVENAKKEMFSSTTANAMPAALPIAEPPTSFPGSEKYQFPPKDVKEKELFKEDENRISEHQITPEVRVQE